MERSTAARRFGPVAVFALVLAVLVAIAARPGGGGDRDRDLAPIPLGARGATANEGARDAAAGSTRAMYYGGEIVIPDRLLDGVPTEGPVHDVTAGDTSDARISALAKALGVSGEVRTDAEGWVVGDDETDVVLRVLRQPGLPWHLGPDKFGVRPVDGGVVVAEPATPQPAPVPKPVEDPDTPVSSDPCAPDSPTCSGTAPKAQPCPSPPDGAEISPACWPPKTPPEPTKPPQPTDADARAVAQRVFDAAGLAGAAITVNDAWSAKEVVATPVVGGLPTVGFETRVTVALSRNVLWASGFLGGTESKGDYPLLAPRDAVTRGGAWGGVRDLALGAPCPPEEPCPTPKPREATALRLGLMYMSSYDAAQGAFLAPAWLLTFEGGTWEEPVLALPDRYIATPSPAPGVQTDPGTGTEPSGGAGSDGGGMPGSTGGASPHTAVDTPVPE